MTLSGHVKNGQITLDHPVELQDGVAVAIEVLEGTNITPPKQVSGTRAFRPIILPGGLLSDEIVRNRR